MKIPLHIQQFREKNRIKQVLELAKEVDHKRRQVRELDSDLLVFMRIFRRAHGEYGYDFEHDHRKAEELGYHRSTICRSKKRLKGIGVIDFEKIRPPFSRYMRIVKVLTELGKLVYFCLFLSFKEIIDFICSILSININSTLGCVLHPVLHPGVKMYRLGGGEGAKRVNFLSGEELERRKQAQIEALLRKK